MSKELWCQQLGSPLSGSHPRAIRALQTDPALSRHFPMVTVSGRNSSSRDLTESSQPAFKAGVITNLTDEEGQSG